MEEQYKGKLTESVIKEYGMDPNVEYEIKEIEPQKLIHSKRIDIIVKLKYIENVEKQLNCQYYNQLYKKHIEAFSGGTFIEYGSEEKNSIDKYIKTFNELITSIKVDGFDENKSLVPVGKENIILDGAHRTSIAIYYHKPLKIIILKDKTIDFGANFFKERLLKIPYIEYIITEYCKLKENIFVFSIWPKTNDRDTIEKKITQNTNVIYSKELELTDNGYRNLMLQMYGKYNCGDNTQNHFESIYAEGENNKKKTKIYIVEATNKGEILELKEEIRNIGNKNQNAIYSTEDKEETIEMAEVLLNKNSLDFLNMAKSDKYESVYETIQLYKQQIEKYNLNPDEFIVDADSVLAVYGLKDEKKTSFLTYNQDYQKIENQCIKCNNENSDLYKETIAEIINNPKFYFYFLGVKFVDIKLIKRYKKNNLNKEKKKDIRQIKRIISHKRNFKYSYDLLKNECKRLKRNYKLECKKRIKNILKILHLRKN